MPQEFRGRKYEVLRGSDVKNDGMYLELADVSSGEYDVVLFAFHSEAEKTMTLSAYREDLPFEMVEWFLGEAKRTLPSDDEPTQGG